MKLWKFLNVILVNYKKWEFLIWEARGGGEDVRYSENSGVGKGM